MGICGKYLSVWIFLGKEIGKGRTKKVESKELQNRRCTISKLRGFSVELSVVESSRLQEAVWGVVALSFIYPSIISARVVQSKAE